MGERDAYEALRDLAADAGRSHDEEIRRRLTSAEEHIAQLEVAVEHRTVIGQAVGILIERYHLDAETALSALKRVSSTTNRKVYDIALELSQSGSSEEFTQE